MYPNLNEDEPKKTNENQRENNAGTPEDYSTPMTEYTGFGSTPDEYSFNRRILRILCYVGFGLVLAGLIIELAGISAAGATVDYFEMICVLAPIVVLVLNFMNKVRFSINYVKAILLCTLVSTVSSFFRVITYGRLSSLTEYNGPYGGASAGAFFVFSGEALMFTATALVTKGF